MTESWEIIVSKKRKALKECIPKEWVIPNLKDDMLSKGFVNTSKYLDTIISNDEIKITTKTVPQLSKLISSGQLTSVEVTKAFAHRAMLAHQILNCCSEIFIDKALERAKYLDEIFEKTGKTIGILHGIPLSLKDQVDLKGIPSSIGYVSLANIKKTENSLLADKLLEVGAIFFVKTCVPMAMMAPETESNLYPYTHSAVNINLSSGGSSGGEGALIGAGGARIGFGTDIGGSIRIPSTYNGIFSIKPSVGRVSYLRVSNSYESQECVPSVIGPMAQTLEEVEFMMKIITSTKCWLYDPKVLPLEWRDYEISNIEKLKIGIWYDSGNVEPMPAITRVLGEVAEDLGKLDNIEVIKVQWPDHPRLITALFNVYGADGCKEIINECKKSGEPIHKLLEYLVGTETKTALNINEWWDLCKEVYLIKQVYLKFWADNELDAIIAPVMANTSVMPYDFACLDYTGVCNLCDCSGVVIPLGEVDASIDILKERPARSDIEEKIRSQYNPKTFDGMPDNYFITSRLLKRFPLLLDNIDPSNGWSNLHYSAYHNNYQICELLLKYIHSRFISTSLKLSNQDNSIKLKSKGSSLYNQITNEDEIKLTFDKQTVLHIACLGNSAATLNLLLSYFNVCIDQRDNNGYTPTHICCIKGYSDCLSILLEKGSYPNIQDTDGDTPLHKAFQYSNIKCIGILLKYNADDQLLNNVGWKPTDVAFNNDVIQEYKNFKSSISSNSSLTTVHCLNDSDLITKTPQTKYAPIKVTQNNVSSISFLPSNHNSSLSNYQTRINLPPIQPRKYSLSSMLSDEYVDKFDSHEDSRSSTSSKNSRNSSPSCSSCNHNLLLPRKSPSIVPQDSNHQLNSKRYPQPPLLSANPNQSPSISSPRRSTISHSVHDSPTSKRSSLSTRTFRSNSQISDNTSPIKTDYPQLIQQTTGSSLVKSGNSTPRHSLQSGYRTINSSYPIPLQVEEASSKLHDLKLKNVDRLKLDTKLGNIINNTSQENLISSPTSLHINSSNLMTDNTDNKNNSLDLTKRSKILSIPILSSRVRHNS
ncbi:hypothetical protein C6P40_001477 [Pichia californica]|uniref:amidase n=1 Tax=Pichia californica TaxID=460514 RepID=A0A9P7BFF1_9ASCO|nr:hypothetical protein C6P40_001477 [[Candida] californica]